MENFAPGIYVENDMNPVVLLLLAALLLGCGEQNVFPQTTQADAVSETAFTKTKITDTNSWAYFLQHLPEKEGPVLDYRGVPIAGQQKSAALINYDVGTRDLQQCADALMRLRAEYLFGQQRYNEIQFHFTNGMLYAFLEYCSGKRPIPEGNNIRFSNTAPVAVSHQSLRRYLDIVYTYAGTLSLAKELHNTTQFAIGTVVIRPGSPGHCFIITDEAQTSSGEKLYKLVEGYTPAQSIYVLQNIREPDLGYWHRLTHGTIETASYTFTAYQLKTFE